MHKLKALPRWITIVGGWFSLLRLNATNYSPGFCPLYSFYLFIYWEELFFVIVISPSWQIISLLRWRSRTILFQIFRKFNNIWFTSDNLKNQFQSHKRRKKNKSHGKKYFISDSRVSSHYVGFELLFWIYIFSVLRIF